MLIIISSPYIPYIMKKMQKLYTGWLSLLFLYRLCILHTDAMKIKLLENTKRMYAIENINKIAHYSAKLMGRKNEYP